VKLKLVQYPCKSGFPSALRGRPDLVVLAVFTAGLASCFAAAPDVTWAATNAGANITAAAAITARKVDDDPK
jgi:hypothetical protein